MAMVMGSMAIIPVKEKNMRNKKGVALSYTFFIIHEVH